MFPLFYATPPSLCILHNNNFFRGHDLCKSANDYGLNNNTEIVVYKERDDRLRAVISVKVFGECLNNLNGFQLRLYVVDLNHGYAFDLTVIKAVVIQKNSFPIIYLYEFHCTSTDDILETLGDVSKYDHYVWDSQAMDGIGKNSSEFSSEKTSGQDRMKAYGQVADDMVIAEVPVADRMDAGSVENSAAANVNDSDVNDCHRVEMFVRIEQVESSDVPLHDATSRM